MAAVLFEVVVDSSRKSKLAPSDCNSVKVDSEKERHIEV